MKKLTTMLASLVMVLTLASFAQAGGLDSKDINTNPTNAILTVIHGIPGLPTDVDVFADGAYLFSFGYTESQGPLSLPAGDYFLEVRLGGQTVLSAEASLVAGRNYTAIAHQTYIDDQNSGIKLSLFENNINKADFFRTRLTVRHTAYAPAVDAEFWRFVRSQRINVLLAKPLNLANYDELSPGQFGELDVVQGKYTASLTPAGTSTEVFNSGKLDLEAGKSYIVYAIGSIFDGSFTLFVQVIDL